MRGRGWPDLRLVDGGFRGRTRAPPGFTWLEPVQEGQGSGAQGLHNCVAEKRPVPRSYVGSVAELCDIILPV